MVTSQKNVKSVFILLAVAIALLALFVFLPTHSAPAYAANEPTYNSGEDVYEIGSAAQLLRLAELVNSGEKTGGNYWASLSYKLTADIDLTGETWTPIGLGDGTYEMYIEITDTIASLYAIEEDVNKPVFTSTWNAHYTEFFTDDNGTPASDTYDTTADYYFRYAVPNAFYGAFDGNGHVISNITYLSTSTPYNGLFGYLKNATVTGVTVADSDCDVSVVSLASPYIGGIAGFAENSDISGCGLVSSTLYGKDYAGGIAGKIREKVDSYSNIYSSVNNAIKTAIESAFRTPKTSHALSSCYSIANDVYSDGYSAGILAYADGNTISAITVKHSYNSSNIGSCASSQEVLSGQQTTVFHGAGIVGGCSSTGAVIQYCLGASSVYDSGNLLYGAICPASDHISCISAYYVKDDVGDGRQDDILTPDYNTLHCDLPTVISSSMVQQLGGTTYWNAGSRTNNTCRYPLPASCPAGTQDQFTAYLLTVDDVVTNLHLPGFTYVYPGLTRDGYTHLGWKERGGEVIFDAGDEKVMTSDLDILPVWSLNAPTLSVSSLSFIYTGQTRTITPSVEHPAAGLVATYEWRKENEENWTVAPTLVVKNVSDSGNYYCRVTVSDGVLSATCDEIEDNEDNKITVLIHQKSLYFVVRLSANETQNNAMKTHVYDGNAVTEPTFFQSGSNVGHTIVPTYLYYNDQEQPIERAATKNVGGYTVSATLLIKDGSENDCTANYSVTVEGYPYTVTPKGLLFTVRLSADSEQNAILRTHVYDGNAVSDPLYSQTGLADGHTLSPTYLYYNDQDQSVEKAATANVGEYAISASLLIQDGGDNDCTNNYSITVAPYEYEVTPATMTVVCLKSNISATYSGVAQTLTLADFEIATVNDQVATLTVSGSYTNVVTDETIAYTVSAPNHVDVEGQISVTISPLELVLSKAPSYTELTFTKEYDGTPHYSFAPFLEEMGTNVWYTLSPAVGTFDGELPSVAVLSAAFSQQNAGKNLTVTFSFYLADDHYGNFTLTGANGKLVYDGCTISKKKITVARKNNVSLLLSKPYDKTVDVLGDLAALLNGKYTVSDDSDSVVPASARYTSAFVGDAKDIIVTFSIATDCQNNFVFQSTNENTCDVTFSAIGRITKAEITITKTLPEATFNKTYDRTNSFRIADITSDMYSVTIPTDDVITPTLQSAVYGTANAGETSVVVTFSLNDDSFALATTSQTITFAATIDPYPITIDDVYAVNREYDGTTYVALAGGVLSGVLGGDSVSFNLHGGTIASADASETAYSVSASPITLDNTNYVLSDPTPTGLTVIILKATPNVHPRIAENVSVYWENGLLPEITLTDGDVDGEIDWSQDGTIDWSEYSLYAAGEIDFDWVFTPHSPYDVNYKVMTGKITVTVLQKELTYISVYRLPDKLTYTASETFDTTGMIVYAYYNSGDIVLLTEQTKNSTGYVVEYTTQDKKFHYGSTGEDAVTISYETKSCQVDVTVAKIVLGLPVVGGTEKTYNGYSLSPVIENINSDVVISGTTQMTDRGDYTFTISLKDTSDYQWEDETTAPKEYTWHIYPAGRHLLSLNVSSFVYSGEEQEVIVYNDDNNDKSFFDFSDDSVMSATHAGEYTVTVRLKSNNYYWIDREHPDDKTDNADKVLSWSILARVVGRPSLEDQVYTYNGNVQSVDIVAAEGYTLSGDLTFTNASEEYTIYATLSNIYENGEPKYIDYVWRGDNPTERYALNYSVQKMKITIPQPALSIVSYTGNTYSVRMQSSLYYTVSGNLQESSAGSYSVSANLKDKANTMWADGTSEIKTFTWTILPIYVPKPTVLKDNVYNGYEQTANISYEDIDSPYDLSGYKATDVGTYTARISLKDKTNYRWSNGVADDVTLTWKIVKATVAIPAQPENLFYNGFEQTVNIPQNDAYIISGNKQTNKGTYTATITLKNTQGYSWSDGTIEPKTYTWGIYGITIVSDGEIAEMSANYELSQSLDVPVREGYSFAGWYTSPDFSESSKVTSVDEVTANTTIYAKWTIAQNTGEELPDLNGGGKNSSGLSKSTRDKLMTGGIIFGACLIAAALILILGKFKK